MYYCLVGEEIVCVYSIAICNSTYRIAGKFGKFGESTMIRQTKTTQQVALVIAQPVCFDCTHKLAYLHNAQTTSYMDKLTICIYS